MENIINKAIEGGYDKKYIPVIGIDFPRHHTTVTTILMDREFWQSLSKACGWEEKVLSEDAPHYWVYPWKVAALQFHDRNLTEGWEKAVEYLAGIIENK